MARFNKRPSGLLVPAPIVSTASPSARTGNNAPGFVRDAKSELFLLAVSNFVGQDKFYESAKASDDRFATLVRQVAKEDPGWTKRLLVWLRQDANMRTASLVGAVEAVRSMVAAKIPGGRQLISSVLVRADEPGEMLGYWLSTYPGKQIPKPIKRGIADAVTRLYDERNALKYDTASRAIRFGDVLELTHAAPGREFQKALFKTLIDSRHGNASVGIDLPMIYSNITLRAEATENPRVLLDSARLSATGMTWEDVLSLAGDKLPKKDLWEAMIPNMGYMALLRNLRNFDQAGISSEAMTFVADKLANEDEVARSRQLPMRFLSAYRSVDSLRWGWPLEQALKASLANVPLFAGRTLILIDTSGSMGQQFGKDTKLQFWDAAAIFGLALAARCADADVYSFSNMPKAFPLRPAESLLKALERFQKGYLQNGGTHTELAVRSGYRGHDRVIILTDEQANYHGYSDVTAAVPKDKMVVTFNLAGYQVGHAPSGSGTRVTIGGLSDQAFKLLPVLEKRAAGDWPF